MLGNASLATFIMDRFGVNTGCLVPNTEPTDVVKVQTIIFLVLLKEVISIRS